MVRQRLSARATSPPAPALAPGDPAGGARCCRPA